MSIGENIRAKRQAQNLSQAELAERLNITQSMLCQIERGTKAPSLPLSLEIAQTLKCSVYDFLIVK